MIEILPNWHPVFVHFTVALLLTAAVLFWIGWAVRESHIGATLTTVADWFLWIGAGFTVATVAAGIYAYLTVDHADAAHAYMEEHRNWAIATAIVWWAVALWDGWRVKTRRGATLPFLAALVIGAGLLAVTAFKGGELVYRYGVGVEAVPSSGAGHMHESLPMPMDEGGAMGEHMDEDGHMDGRDHMNGGDHAH